MSGTQSTVKSVTATLLAIIVVLALGRWLTNDESGGGVETRHERTREIQYGARWRPAGVADMITFGPAGALTVVRRQYTPWQRRGTGVPGQRVSMRVEVSYGPDDLDCWITVRGATYSSDDPRYGRRTARTCHVEVYVR